MSQFPKTLDHLSYSAVKTYLESPEQFKHVYIDGNKPERSSAMSLGSIVDCMLTTPDKFEEEYAVETIERPSSSANQNAFAAEIVELYVAGIQPQADEVWKHHYSAKNKTEEAIVTAAKDLFTAWKPYMEFLIDVKTNNKEVLTKVMYEQAFAIVDAVTKHPLAGKWLVSMPGELQKELRWKCSMSEIPILGYLDKLVVDDKNKRAMVIDLKVSGIKNEHQFKSKVRQYKYHVQAWSYVTGVAQMLFEKTGYPYDVSHMYIVVNSDAPHQIMCVQFSENDLEMGATAFYTAVEEIGQKLITNDWTHNKELIKLNVFNQT